MAVTILSEYKNSLRYDLQVGNETTSRTISGINTGTDGDSTGPAPEWAIDYIFQALDSLTTGTIVGGRFVQERRIQL